MDKKFLAENLRKFGEGLSPTQETFLTACDFDAAADFVEASDIFTTEDMVVLRAIKKQRELLNEIADARKELIETEKLLMDWKPMQQWKDAGPPNGDPMLLLLSDGDRRIGFFNGYSQLWICPVTGEGFLPRPISWCELPGVPEKLIERNKKIAAARSALEDLEESSL